jgi:hypothetical protein
MAKEEMRRRRTVLNEAPEHDDDTPAEQDPRTIAPRKDMNIMSFAEYVSYAYTLRAQLVRGEVSLATLSFRQLFNLYLLTSILYYKHDVSFISDEIFDRLCELLVERKDETHKSIFWHGKLFDLEMLKAGSGFHLHINNTPIYLQNAAMVISESRQSSWEAVLGSVQKTFRDDLAGAMAQQIDAQMAREILEPEEDTPVGLPSRRRRIAIDCKPKPDLPTKRRRAKL